jgi:hypothetical protein
MNKRRFKDSVDQLLDQDVDGLSWDQKLALIQQRIVNREKKRNVKAENKGKPWTDEELRLRTAPTVENCMLLARTFRRGYGSIEQIFRWAASRSLIAKKRPDHSFVNQIKRIAEEVGWRAT